MEQIVTDNSLDCLALLSWHFGSPRSSGMQSNNKTANQSEGHQWRAIRHHVEYSRRKKAREGISRAKRVRDAARRLLHVLRLAMDVLGAVVAGGVFWQ